VETHHIFIGGEGQIGEFIPVELTPDLSRPVASVLLRIIYLSADLIKMHGQGGMRAVAREIAHSRLGQSNQFRDRDEARADELLSSWGFGEVSAS
jgi:hypothetical protein